MLRRVEWSAVLAVLYSLAAVGFAVAGEEAIAYVLALGSVTWAILSWKERT